MKEIAYIIILWITSFFWGGCTHDVDGDISDRETLLVNLEVSVALSDISQAKTRAGDITYPEPPAYDNEKMKTLRIIVVRNHDNTVEQNRIISLPAADNTYTEEMKVVGNERKQIYLFVNEATQIKTVGFPRKLVDFDFSKIQVGSLFPTDYLSELTIRLDEATEQIDGPLPMSECHTVDVPGIDHACQLFVTRAAVKFSFKIINDGSSPINITKFTVDKMANKEYYLPHNTTYVERETTNGETFWDINLYDVPATGYYTYRAPSELLGLLPARAEKSSAKPVYLLEGKHSDSKNKAQPYLLTLGIDGAELSSYLPNLPQLPRNTHVVVNITVKERMLNCEVDVRPYSEVILEPDFGLDPDKVTD